MNSNQMKAKQLINKLLESNVSLRQALFGPWNFEGDDVSLGTILANNHGIHPDYDEDNFVGMAVNSWCDMAEEHVNPEELSNPKVQKAMEYTRDVAADPRSVMDVDEDLGLLWDELFPGFSNHVGDIWLRGPG